MREDVGVGSGVVAEPVVVVDADVAVVDELTRHLLRHRRRRHGHGGVGVRKGRAATAGRGPEAGGGGGGERGGARALERSRVGEADEVCSGATTSPPPAAFPLVYVKVAWILFRVSSFLPSLPPAKVAWI